MIVQNCVFSKSYGDHIKIAVFIITLELDSEDQTSSIKKMISHISSKRPIENKGSMRATLIFFYKQPPYKQLALEASKY